jgi:L-lysine exporter family protein LysE/ArgO
MISYLLHIGIGAFLSFIGSIPFGTINVTTADTAIREGFRAALWVAFGAAAVEFIQALLALKFSSLLVENPGVEFTIQWASAIIFAGLAIYFLLRKERHKEPQQARTRARGMLKGITVSALNVLAIPYWIFCGSYLAANDWVELEENRYLVIFSAGVFVGTFLLLTVYARLGVYADSKFNRLASRSGKVAAIIFLLLAAFQVFRVLA